MKEVKLCPLRKINGKTFDHCYKEKCAWYDNMFEQCILVSIEHDLDLLRVKLEQIRDMLEK